MQSKLDIDQLNKLYDGGLNTRELAELYGVSDETIRRYIRRPRSVSETNCLRNAKLREKISKSCKAKWSDPEYVAKVKAGTGTSEYKKAISDASKKNWTNPSFVKKMKDAWVSDGYKKKVSSQVRLYWTSEEYRAKQVIHFSSRAAKASDASQIALQDPVKREKWLQKLRKVSIDRIILKGFISSSQRQLYHILQESEIAFHEEGPQTRVGPFYVVDCIIPKQQEMKRDLIVEVQGEYWHNKSSAQLRDRQRGTYIRKYTNYDLLLIEELDVSNWQQVYSKFLIYGLKLRYQECECNNIIIKRITESEAKLFYSIFHYSSTIRKGAITFGGFLGDRLVVVISYTYPIRTQVATSLNYQQGAVMEISRLARRTNLVCKNLLSWFLARTNKLVPEGVRCIIAYSDSTYGHTGGVYKACNFVCDRTVRPDYFYVSQDGARFHKKTVWDKSKKFKMTELQYARKHKLKRVYGGPKTRWVLNRI